MYQVTTHITSDKVVANNESRLSICLRSNGFSFAIATLDHTLTAFGETEFDFNLPLGSLTQSVKQFFADQHINTFGFKQANLVVQSDNFVWIPAALYDSVRDRQYLKLIGRPAMDMGVYHLYVDAMKSYIVFTAPATVVTAFKVALPGIDVHCQHSVIANDYLLGRSLKHPIMLMNVRERVGDFDAFYNGKLLFCNSCSATSDSELLYHALEIMKTLHLETPDMELAISGNVGRDIFALLQHYFPNVTLYTGHPMQQVLPEFQTFHTFQHVLLL